ncbi:MAG: CHAD domain-containing protein [Candidatus Limnocylindria bacterium]
MKRTKADKRADRLAAVPPVEIELKFRVDDRAAAETVVALDRIGSLSAEPETARDVVMEDRYVDTADGALARAGLVARLRELDDRTLVSVKSLHREEAAGGATRRTEIEGPADPVAPPADWPASDARALIIEHAGTQPLVELVTLRQHRRKRLYGSDAATVELSVDDIEVLAGDTVIERFTELEAELVGGDEAALAVVAAVLDGEPGLRRATSSKLDAAMAALDVHRPTDGEPTDGEPTAMDEVAVAAVIEAIAAATASPETPPLSVGRSPGVGADDHVAEAGRKVLRFHLARMLDHEAGTRSGEVAEDLHKMRVATRRQRAAWRVFGSAFRPRRTKRYRDGLREIAARLGAVRDLDVQLEAADAYRADLPVAEQRALEPLLRSWRTHRDVARSLLIRELDSDGYRRWLDDYRDFVRTEGALVLPVGPVQPHRVRDTAPSRIWAAYEQLRGYEPVLRWADVETLHDLRIAAKWLRYSLEFTREALGPEAGTLIARVTALQDHLGLMNDADVTASMTRTFLVASAGELSSLESAAIGRYLVDREREVARLRRTMGPAWRAASGLRFRRALGRVVAEL